MTAARAIRDRDGPPLRF